MELHTLKKTKTELELEVVDEDETILMPITHVLMKDDSVEYASCLSDHPLATKRRLYIRMKTGNPETALKKAVSFLENEVKKFAKTIS